MSDSLLLLCITMTGSTIAGGGWLTWYMCSKLKNKEPSSETVDFVNTMSKAGVIMILFGSIMNSIGLFTLLNFTGYVS